MQKLPSFLLVFLLTTFPLIVEQAASAEIRDGIETTRYPSGELESETPYRDGQIEGVAKEYFKSGKLRSVSPYKAGKREGTAVTYLENGGVKSEVEFKNGKRHGLRKQYWDHGKLSREDRFVDGLREGKLISYDSKGQVNVVQEFRRDQPHGKLLVYDPLNPKMLMYEAEFKDGLKDGAETYFYPNTSSLRDVAHYKMDKLHGEKIYYDQSGRVERVERYENGEKIP